MLSIILGDDDWHTMDKIVIYGESRPVRWSVKNPKTQSRLFSSFPRDLVNYMSHKDVALHAHDYSISMESFHSKPGLSRFMKVLQTDVHM